MQMHYCIADILENMIVKKMETASPSIFIYGNLKQDEVGGGELKAHDAVVAKLAVESSADDNALAIERGIYMLIKKELAQLSPHFLRGVYQGSCQDSFILAGKTSPFDSEQRKLFDLWIELRADQIQYRLLQSDKPKLRAALDAWKVMFPNEEFDMVEAIQHIPLLQNLLNSVYFVITPKMKGVSLQDFLDKKMYRKLSLAYGKNFDVLVTMQVAQALSVMEHFQLRHNDLHTGNVFIEIFDDEQSIDYTFPIVFSLKTRFKITIYDFDQAALVPEYTNHTVDAAFCENIGECSKFVKNFDFYTFLVYFQEALSQHSDFVKPVITIKSVLGNQFYEADKARTRHEVGLDAYFGRPCECKKLTAEGDACESCEIRQVFLAQMQSPADFFKLYARKRLAGVF
jgi:hypothetical protein